MSFPRADELDDDFAEAAAEAEEGWSVDDFIDVIVGSEISALRGLDPNPKTTL